MKNKSNLSLFVGIILFLIYERSFYILFSLNEIFLFQFKVAEALYVVGLVVTVILTNLVAITLYQSFIRSKVDKGYIQRLIAILLLCVVIPFCENYYLGILGRSGVEQESQDIFFKYYNYTGVIYFVNTAILMSVYGIYILKKKNKL